MMSLAVYLQKQSNFGVCTYNQQYNIQPFRMRRSHARSLTQKS